MYYQPFSTNCFYSNLLSFWSKLKKSFIISILLLVLNSVFLWIITGLICSSCYWISCQINLIQLHLICTFCSRKAAVTKDRVRAKSHTTVTVPFFNQCYYLCNNHVHERVNVHHTAFWNWDNMHTVWKGSVFEMVVGKYWKTCAHCVLWSVTQVPSHHILYKLDCLMWWTNTVDLHPLSQTRNLWKCDEAT